MICNNKARNTHFVFPKQPTSFLYRNPLYVSMVTRFMLSWQPTLCFHGNPRYVSIATHFILPWQPTLYFHGNPLDSLCDRKSGSGRSGHFFQIRFRPNTDRIDRIL